MISWMKQELPGDKRKVVRKGIEQVRLEQDDTIEQEKERLLHLLGYTDWINHSMPSSSGGKRSESGRRPEMRAELPRMR